VALAGRNRNSTGTHQHYAFGEECDVATSEERTDPAESALPEPSDTAGAAASARESVKERIAHLRERAERTRAGIEARRTDSASIDAAFEAVERDAQSGGGAGLEGDLVSPP
jgi:hypothetical protein